MGHNTTSSIRIFVVSNIKTDPTIQWLDALLAA